MKFQVQNQKWEKKKCNLTKTLILIYSSQGLNISIQIPQSDLLTHHIFISKALNNLALFQWGRKELNILACCIFVVVILNYYLSWKPSRIQDPIWCPFNYTQQWAGKGSNLRYSVLNVAISFSCYNVKETMGINNKKQIYFPGLFWISQSRLKYNSQKSTVFPSHRNILGLSLLVSCRNNLKKLPTETLRSVCCHKLFHTSPHCQSQWQRFYAEFPISLLSSRTSSVKTKESSTQIRQITKDLNFKYVKNWCLLEWDNFQL